MGSSTSCFGVEGFDASETVDSTFELGGVLRSGAKLVGGTIVSLGLVMIGGTLPGISRGFGGAVSFVTGGVPVRLLWSKRLMRFATL